MVFRYLIPLCQWRRLSRIPDRKIAASIEIVGKKKPERPFLFSDLVHAYVRV